MRQLRPIPVSWLVNNHHEKLGKKMDTQKWKNGVRESIEQKFVCNKMGRVAVIEYYSILLGEYNVELTNNLNLVVKLRQDTCTYKS